MKTLAGLCLMHWEIYFGRTVLGQSAGVSDGLLQVLGHCIILSMQRDVRPPLNSKALIMKCARLYIKLFPILILHEGLVMKHSLYIMLQNKRVHTSIHASRHLERKNAHLCMHLVHTSFWHSRGGGWKRLQGASL